MSTLRINNIEAQSVPASPTIDEKVKVTNSSGDILVNIDGKTSGITTIGINTTDGNIKFDANSNVLITGILTATTLAGNFTPDSLDVTGGLNVVGVATASNFKTGSSNLHSTGLTVGNNFLHTTGINVGTGATIHVPSSNVLTLGTNDNERIRITSDGNLGLGDNNPPNFTGYTSLSIHGSTGGALVFGDDGTDEWEIYGGDGVIKIYDRANTQERIRISDNGAIGLGGANYGSSGQVLTSGGSGSAATWSTVSGTTINSNADNRVITGSGTANTLNAAGNFTHDATNCDTTIQGYEALKVIDLIVKNTNNHGNAAGARITIESGSAANTGPQFGMICGSHSWYLQVPKAAGNLEFNNNNTGTNFLMADDGDFHINDGDLVLASGHGIDFSATGGPTNGTGSSELLDDYEEGLWVPLIRNTSGSGTYGSGNVGSYTKIGNMVHISGTIHWTAMSGTTNWAGVIRNLPFASYSGTGFYRSACVVGATSGLTPNNSGSPNVVFIMDRAQGFLYIVGTNTTSGGFTHYPTISNAGSVYGFDLSYRVS